MSPILDEERRNRLADAFDVVSAGGAVPADLSPEDREILAQEWDKQEALSAESTFGDTGTGMSQQAQLAQGYAGMTPEQRSMADSAQAERGRTVADVMVPGVEDLKTGGALAIGNVAANAFPVTRVARPFVQAGLALGGKQALDAAPEFISQAAGGMKEVAKGAWEGAKNWWDSPANSPGGFAEPFMQGVNRGASQVDFEKIYDATDPKNTMGEIAGIVGGKAVDVVGGALLKKAQPFFNPQSKLKEVYADQATKAIGIDRAKLMDFEVTAAGKARPSLYDSIIKIADDGTLITGDLPSAVGTIGQRKQQLGQELNAQLDAASQAYFNNLRGTKAFGEKFAQNSDAAAEFLNNKFQNKLLSIKQELGQGGKDTWLKDLDEAGKWVETQLLEASAERASIGLSSDVSLSSLNAIKSRLYQGARFPAANPPQSSLFVDRQVARALKETIEDVVGDPRLKEVNALYGAYEEVDEALRGRLATYFRGDQMNFGAQMQNMAGPAGVMNMMQQNAQSPSMGAKMAGGLFAAFAANAATKTPGFRRASANMAISLAQGGLPIQLANAYAGPRLIEAMVTSAAASPLPRDSDRPFSVEMSGPRIVSSLIDAGLPPDIAMQEGVRIAEDLNSASSVKRDMALKELAMMVPAALGEHESGLNVVNGRFLLPEEQSFYIRDRLQKSKSLEDEANSVGAAISGRYPTASQDNRLPETQKELPLSTPIDMENIEGAFSMPSYQTSAVQPSNPEEEDPVARMNRLAAGTDRQAY